MGNKLPKGEKGLDKALENNEKFEKNNQYKKFEFDLNYAINLKKEAEEGFSVNVEDYYDRHMQRNAYTKIVTYKKGNEFILKREEGYYTDDKAKTNRTPEKKQYFVIKQNEQERYEISTLSVKASSFGPATVVKFDLGTDKANSYSGDTAQSIFSSENKMTKHEENLFDQLLVGANKLEEMEIRLNTKKVVNEFVNPKGPKVENNFKSEVTTSNDIEVETPEGPRVRTAEAAGEMDL